VEVISLYYILNNVQRVNIALRIIKLINIYRSY